MVLGVKRAQRDYSLTFKLALVEQIEKGELKVGTGCFGYWPSTVCWCHPGGVSQEYPQFSPFLPSSQLAQGWAELVNPVAPEQVWVADITYLPAKSGPLYLSLVADAYSRKIVGHKIVGHQVHGGMHA